MIEFLENNHQLKEEIKNSMYNKHQKRKRDLIEQIFLAKKKKEQLDNEKAKIDPKPLQKYIALV